MWTSVSETMRELPLTEHQIALEKQAAPWNADICLSAEIWKNAILFCFRKQNVTEIG